MHPLSALTVLERRPGEVQNDDYLGETHPISDMIKSAYTLFN